MLYLSLRDPNKSLSLIARQWVIPLLSRSSNGKRLQGWITATGNAIILLVWNCFHRLLLFKCTWKLQLNNFLYYFFVFIILIIYLCYTVTRGKFILQLATLTRAVARQVENELARVIPSLRNLSRSEKLRCESPKSWTPLYFSQRFEASCKRATWN